MRATPANKKAAAEDNYLCGSFLVRPNTFLNQKSSYLCVLVEARGVEQFQVFSSEIKAICLQKISE